MDSVDIAVILAYIFLIEAFYYPRFVVLKWRYAINPMTKKAVKQFSKTENQLPPLLLFSERIRRPEHKEEYLHVFYLLMTCYNFLLYVNVVLLEYPPEVQLIVCVLTVLLNIEIALRLMFPKPRKVLRGDTLHCQNI